MTNKFYINLSKDYKNKSKKIGNKNYPSYNKPSPPSESNYLTIHNFES